MWETLGQSLKMQKSQKIKESRAENISSRLSRQSDIFTEGAKSWPDLKI